MSNYTNSNFNDQQSGSDEDDVAEAASANNRPPLQKELTLSGLSEPITNSKILRDYIDSILVLGGFYNYSYLCTVTTTDGIQISTNETSEPTSIKHPSKEIDEQDANGLVRQERLENDIIAALCAENLRIECFSYIAFDHEGNECSGIINPNAPTIDITASQGYSDNNDSQDEEEKASVNEDMITTEQDVGGDDDANYGDAAPDSNSKSDEERGTYDAELLNARTVSGGYGSESGSID